MSVECPIHNFPDSSLSDILDRIEDKSLLVTLACDYAERVADLTDDPKKTRKWLAAARNWEKNPEGAEKAANATYAAANAANAAAANATNAAEDSEAEEAWQMEHTIELCCRCIPEVELTDAIFGRSRTSLLCSGGE